MFEFFNSKPALCPGNPGIGVEANIAFSGDRHAPEKVNAVHLIATVLKQRGYAVRTENVWFSPGWLFHIESGFKILPQLVAVHPIDDGGVRTVSTVQVNHDTLSPSGVFEYQHSAGSTVAESLSNGFDQWAQTDFTPLLDAVKPKPSSCMTMVMKLPARDGKPARVRRVVLGPVAHFMKNPPDLDDNVTEEEHPFCPCCLFTNSVAAFKDLIDEERTFGLRLFVSRSEDGICQADCRVNGEDWDRGAELLRAYASTWPAAGFEFRKQYVVLQNLDDHVESDEGI